MFAITSMPVGGAETLLVNLVRTFDRNRIQPKIVCLKEPGVLGEQLKGELPVYDHLIRGKFDVMVLRRLSKLFSQQRVDALVTVGAGDKMFWGRLGARIAGVPVILSALHSTGWPDGVGKLNRLLTPITDGFIGVARSHGEFLTQFEKFPQSKVFVVRNGIDTARFVFDEVKRMEWRRRLKLAGDAPVVGIVAALRPEKNHRLFLEAVQRVSAALPNARYLIAGEGPLRGELEGYARQLGVGDSVQFVGNVDDTPGFLSAIDLFALTSDNEASPVSIVEAMACSRPVVATNVGSINELVTVGVTGLLTPTQAADAIAKSWLQILTQPEIQWAFGQEGRKQVVQTSSLQSMVDGYTRLIERLFSSKTGISIKPQVPIQPNFEASAQPITPTSRFK